jgi:hypothetical protein
MSSKDAVMDTGMYEVLGDKGVSFGKRKFIAVLKEENNKLKMHSNTGNTDITAAAPAK